MKLPVKEQSINDRKLKKYRSATIARNRAMIRSGAKSKGYVQYVHFMEEYLALRHMKEVNVHEDTAFYYLIIVSVRASDNRQRFVLFLMPRVKVTRE